MTNEIKCQRLPEVSFNRVKCIHGFDAIRENYPDYLTDESKLSAAHFDTLFFPENEQELAVILASMNHQSVPVTIAGARTGLVGGSVPMAGALVALDRLNRIQRVSFTSETNEWRVVLQAGVNLKTLDTFLINRSEKEVENSNTPEFQVFKSSPAHYFYPPDPTEMSASIGGTVATNASGACTYRYGPTRSWVKGIRVFLANGEYLDIPRGRYYASDQGHFILKHSDGRVDTLRIPRYTLPHTKNAAGLFTAPGMDLIDLFIGSEGILGVITQVEVGLLERSEKLSMIQFLETEDQALELTTALRDQSTIEPDFIEFYSANTLDLLRNTSHQYLNTQTLPEIPDTAYAALFFAFDYDPDSSDEKLAFLETLISSAGADMANSWVGFDERDQERFKAFRHQVPETINRIVAERKKSWPAIHKLGSDMAVPDQFLREIWSTYRTTCEASGLEWYAFGHIGNNHIHINIVPRTLDELEKGKEIFEGFARTAVEMGGTVSAEHGIGKIKTRYFRLMYQPDEIDQMRAVKSVLDPKGILNPGDLL